MKNQERTPEIILKHIQSYKLNLLAYLGMYRAYDSWNSDLLDELTDELDEKYTNELDGGPVTISELMVFDHDTLVDKIELGLWTINETEEGDMYVYALPIWLLPILDQNSEVYSIFELGDKAVNGDDCALQKTRQTDYGKPVKLKDADNDVRYGCIAYGFAKYYPKQTDVNNAEDCDGGDN